MRAKEKITQSINHCSEGLCAIYSFSTVVNNFLDSVLHISNGIYLGWNLSPILFLCTVFVLCAFQTVQRERNIVYAFRLTSSPLKEHLDKFCLNIEFCYTVKQRVFFFVSVYWRISRPNYSKAHPTAWSIIVPMLWVGCLTSDLLRLIPTSVTESFICSPTHHVFERYCSKDVFSASWVVCQHSFIQRKI